MSRFPSPTDILNVLPRKTIRWLTKMNKAHEENDNGLNDAT